MGNALTKADPNQYVTTYRYDYRNRLTQVLYKTASGAVGKSVEYDSFGDLKSQTNAAVEHLFAYTGRFLDELTGDQNHLHRWYDPDIAQWLSEDPIGFAGGGANLKRYVGNSPTNYEDPEGLEWKRIPDHIIREMGGEPTIANIKRGFNVPGNADLLWDPATREMGYAARESSHVEPLGDTVDEYMQRGSREGGAKGRGRRGRGGPGGGLAGATCVVNAAQICVDVTKEIQAGNPVAGMPGYCFGNVPYVFQDEGGPFVVFEVRESCLWSLSFGYKYYKFYDIGKAMRYSTADQMGFDVSDLWDKIRCSPHLQEIDAATYGRLRNEGRKRWGYNRWDWGKMGYEFVPGTERQSLPVLKLPPGGQVF